MKYRKLRNLLFDMVFNKNEFIPNEFSYKNKEYLIRHVDKNLISYCKIMFHKDTNKLKNVINLLVSFLSFYVLYKIGFSKSLLDPKLYLVVIIIHTNVSFMLSTGFVKVFHKTHVKTKYKVRVKKSWKDMFGYYLAYIGYDKKGRILVISLNRVKKNIRLVNPKVFIVKRNYIETIIIEYLYSKKVKDINWLKNEIFMDVKTEMFKSIAREQAIDDFIDMQEMSEREMSNV